MELSGMATQTTINSDNYTSPHPTQIRSSLVESNNLPSTRNYNRELFRVCASRLVDIFPDELVIQEKTISIVRRHFLVNFVETLPVKDIGRVVFVDTPFFVGLRIIGKNTAHELHIKGLYKAPALVAKEVIDGLLLEEKGTIEIPYWLQADERSDRLADAGRHPQLKKV